MDNFARNLTILGIALGIWGISFLFVGEPSAPDDPTRRPCYDYLDQIQRAKKQWAIRNSKTADAVPIANDLLPYLADKKMPECPGSGKYSINAVTNWPQCSITTHSYP